MDNLDDFLAPVPEGEAAPVETVAETAPVEATPETTETEEQKATRERDERGRFKAKEADEPVMVPLKALHETRDEVKALKAQLEALNRQPQQQPEVPDVFVDQEGFNNHINSQIQRSVLNATLNLSEEMTTQQYGADEVDQAKQWGAQAFQANPALLQTFYSQRNPYGFLVAEYRKQSMLSQLDPNEFNAFLAWKEAQKAPPAPPAVPDTLADAQSARGSTAEAYRVPTLDEILKR